MLAGAQDVSVAQRGLDHQNRLTEPTAGLDLQRSRLGALLRRGWALIKTLPYAEPVFVPPCNDVHPELEAALLDCGYAGWSASAEMEASYVLPRVDVHLDLLGWSGGARFPGRRKFLGALASELAIRRRSRCWRAPIGLLTHHLDQDARAWSFLEDFLEWSGSQRAIVWLSLGELLPGALGRARHLTATGRSAPLPAVREG
jgi:hypothetical protein